MISKGQLIEWKHLSDTATDGPWDYTEVIAGVDSFVVHQRVGDKFGAKYIASQVSNEDAEFMIAARKAMPALIDRVHELEHVINWIIENADACPPGLEHDIACLKNKNKACIDCWKEKAFKAIHDNVEI